MAKQSPARSLRYEELTQSQWTAWLTTLAAQEQNPIIQRNMLAFISSLLQDVCDVGLVVCRSALALILVMMEESRLTWLYLASFQEIREKYCYRFVVAPTSSQPANNTRLSNQNSKPKAVKAQPWMCRNFNSTCLLTYHRWVQL